MWLFVMLLVLQRLMAGFCRVDVIRVGADLRVRCSTARRVTLCRDARLVSSGRASVPEPAVTFDTTDAQTERPYFKFAE